MCVIILSVLSTEAFAKRDSLRYDLPLIKRSGKGKIVQELYYFTPRAHKAQFVIRCYRISNAGDSLLVYSSTSKANFKKKVGVIKIDLTKDGRQKFVHPDVRQILLKTKSLPAGVYHMYAEYAKDSGKNTRLFLYKVDTILAPGSFLKQRFNDIYAPFPAQRKGKHAITTPALIRKSAKTIDRELKAKGLAGVYRKGSDKEYMDVFYKDWLIGTYPIDTGKKLAQSILQEQVRLDTDPVSFVRTELEQFQSVGGQIRELNKNKDEKKYVIGEVGMAVFSGNGQEEQSLQNNNYVEWRGRVDLPFDMLPISVEGFYTSQDRTRQARASYLKFHYDTEQAKKQLSELISEYRTKQETVEAKGKGLDAIYSSYLQKLKSQQAALLAEINTDETIPSTNFPSVPSAGLPQRFSDSLQAKATKISSKSADSLNGANDQKAAVMERKSAAVAAKDSATKRVERIMEKKKRLEQLQQQISKYETLISQYKNANHFDSLLAYDKVKDIRQSGDLSYKEMARKADHLLPEGKANTFVAGINSLDIGVFSKDVSSYTLSGQTVKGIDFSYDFGRCQSAFTMGAVEYISRSGIVDRYTGYSGRLGFSPRKGHNASVIYYGYTPSRQMLRDDEFFKDVDVAMPSFRTPVHIVSATYEGFYKDHVSYQAEVATSFRNKSIQHGVKEILRDHSAYNVNTEVAVPGTTATLEAGYERIGQSFENNSLPVAMTGTERYKLGAKADFFRDFLTVGVDYNYLRQESFASSGGNMKWGFMIKTVSRVYPTISISYKPFATFRTFNDTLSIPQQPLVGSVWTGTASYQVKSKEYSLRFTSVYNRNRTEMDSISQGSSTMQFNAIYMRENLSGMVTIGTTSVLGNASAVHGNTTFLGLSGNYVLNEQWSVSLMQDVAKANFGLSRYGAGSGCTYRFKKIPVTLRSSIRYNTYRLKADNAWRHLVLGSLDMSWQFKFRWKD